jgi:hypothetical protein
VENGRVWLPRESRGVKSYVDGSVGDHNLVLPRRGRRRITDDCIEIQNWSATFKTRPFNEKKEPDLTPLLKLIWGTPGEDALRRRVGASLGTVLDTSD